MMAEEIIWVMNSGSSLRAADGVHGSVAWVSCMGREAEEEAGREGVYRHEQCGIPRPLPSVPAAAVLAPALVPPPRLLQPAPMQGGATSAHPSGLILGRE